MFLANFFRFKPLLRPIVSNVDKNSSCLRQSADTTHTINSYPNVVTVRMAHDHRGNKDKADTICEKLSTISTEGPDFTDDSNNNITLYYDHLRQDVLNHKKLTLAERLAQAELPIDGDITYIPPRNYRPHLPLPRGAKKGFIDRASNEWVKGPSRTIGETFEWDVQLSRKGLENFKSFRKKRKHLNVTLTGCVSH